VGKDRVKPVEAHSIMPISPHIILYEKPFCFAAPIIILLLIIKIRLHIG
jgi:hypothetical protein